MKKLVSIALALVMALGLCVTTAWAAGDKDYLRWDETTKGLVSDTLADEITLNELADGTTTWTAGWYVATGTVTINSKVTVTGNVNLLLRDNCELTINGGIEATTDSSLTIYAQSLDESTAGKLTVTGSGDFYYGINSDTLTINGGIIKATGNAAEVERPSSHGIMSNTLTINGGIIEATGGYASSSEAWSCGIYAYNTLTINGGIIKATGGSAKSGSSANSHGIYSSTKMIISNSTVTATGGSATSDMLKTSSGINGDKLVISNSTVEGKGGEAAGSSYGISFLQLTLNSGTVTGTAGTSGNRVGINTSEKLILPTTYWWYTAEDGTPTASSELQLTKAMEKDYSYLKITTIAPAGGTSDTESVSGGHTPIRRQNTTAVTTTDTTTDTTKTDTVTSAKTFDAGVAVYGVLAVTSLLGMGYVGKKR